MLSNQLCACGCGRFTSISEQTRPRRGWVKGQPLRFARGHTGRGPNKRYESITVNGQINRVHCLRAEAALGKALPPRAEVHHADGSKRSDAPLVICQDRAYHMMLHVRMRVKAAGGDPNTDRVCKCGFVGPKAEYFSRDKSWDGFSSRCIRCQKAARRLRTQRDKCLRTHRYSHPILTLGARVRFPQA
jgi:hypothetical protein